MRTRKLAVAIAIGLSFGSSIALSTSVSAEDRDAISSHNAMLDDLLRKKEILSIEAEVAKLELDHQKTNADIKKLKAGGVVVKGLPEGAMPGSELVEYIKEPVQEALREESAEAASREKDDNSLDYVFVTRLYGIGADREATIYYKNGLFNGRAGSEVVDGIKISKITDNGVVVTYKGKSRVVNLTSQGQAYQRTGEIESSNQSFSGHSHQQNMAREMLITPPGF